jgi:hypothetical protein
MEHDTIEFIDNLPVCTGTKVKKCITGVASLLYWRKKRESIYQYVPAKMMQTFLSKKNACENHIMWIGKEGYSQKKRMCGFRIKTMGGATIFDVGRIWVSHLGRLRSEP